MKAVEFDELGRIERIGEFLGEQVRVGVADAKGYHRADIAKHGSPDIERELVEVLM